MLIVWPAIVFIILLVLFTLDSLFNLIAAISGPFFVPSNEEQIQTIVKLAQIKPGQKVADLGSGDGRVLSALAQKGAYAYGFEINPFLVWRSRWKIKKAGLEKSITVYLKDFWGVNLNSFDLIVIYGIPRIMKKLKKKLEKELKKEARIISVYYPFPNWHTKKSLNNIHLYLRAHNPGSSEF